MSDTKDTTEDERLALAFLIARRAKDGYPEIKEWSEFGVAVQNDALWMIRKARELLAPADVALEPLSEDWDARESLESAITAACEQSGYHFGIGEGCPVAAGAALRWFDARAKLTRNPPEPAVVSPEKAATPGERPMGETPLPRTILERIKNFKATTGALSGGAGHPDRCVCQDKPDAYPGTPHQHYQEPPFECARCGCKGYKPSVKEKPPEVVPPEVTTDALNKLLADTANGWRSGGALHIAFTEDIRANVRANIDEARTFVVNMRDNLEADDKRSPFYILSLVVEHLSRAMKEGGQ